MPPYPLEEQTQDFWCWAAVASSVRAFFRPASRLSQSDVATETLNQHEAPGHRCDMNPAPCNIPYYLDKALETIGHLNAIYPAPLSWNDVDYLIRNNRPICAYLETSTSGHYVVISDCARYSGGVETLFICDPDDDTFGPVEVLYDAFLFDYQAAGYQWKGCFLIKP